VIRIDHGSATDLKDVAGITDLTDLPLSFAKGRSREECLILASRVTF